MIMRKLNAMTVSFIAIILTITIDSFVLLTAIDNLTDAVRESNKANEQVVIAYEETNEVSEEIVYVTYEKQDDGDMIYDFGDVSDEYYFYIIINEEQGIYEYYFPAMHIDWPIECNSLEELQDVISCHIEQAYPNATFVIR
jgi:hypothetical protein